MGPVSMSRVLAEMAANSFTGFVAGGWQGDYAAQMGEIGEWITLLRALMEHILRAGGMNHDGFAAVRRRTCFGKIPLERRQCCRHTIRLSV
jgi:hypothetical protein